jgi:hypothetical protein
MATLILSITLFEGGYRPERAENDQRRTKSLMGKSFVNRLKLLIFYIFLGFITTLKNFLD